MGERSLKSWTRHFVRTQAMNFPFLPSLKTQTCKELRFMIETKKLKGFRVDSVAAGYAL